MVSVFTVYVAWQGLILSEQRDISDRFNQATEQLGSSDPVQRLAGIDSLKSLVADDPDSERRAVDYLAGFLRVKANTRTQDCGSSSTALQAEAILAGIGQINTSDNRETPIDLSGTCLAQVKVSDINLSNANFTGANLEAAIFIKVRFRHARFDVANLAGASFTSVDLTAAVFCYADISNAVFNPTLVLTDTAIDVDKNSQLTRVPIDAAHVERCV